MFSLGKVIRLPYLQKTLSCGLSIAVVSVNRVRSTYASGLKTAFTNTERGKGLHSLSCVILLRSGFSSKIFPRTLKARLLTYASMFF